MRTIFYATAFTVLLFSCSTSSTQETPQNPDSGEVENTSTEWTIPVEEVLDGGPGRDGIPALENPMMIGADDTVTLDNILVLGYKKRF